MIKIIENMKTPHDLKKKKWAFLGGSTKLKTSTWTPTFLYIFSNQVDPNTRKNTTFFEFPICNNKFFRSGQRP